MGGTVILHFIVVTWRPSHFAALVEVLAAQPARVDGVAAPAPAEEQLGGDDEVSDTTA
jgi:hypothetical protein